MTDAKSASLAYLHVKKANNPKCPIQFFSLSKVYFQCLHASTCARVEPMMYHYVSNMLEKPGYFPCPASI